MRHPISIEFLQNSIARYTTSAGPRGDKRLLRRSRQRIVKTLSVLRDDSAARLGQLRHRQWTEASFDVVRRAQSVRGTGLKPPLRGIFDPAGA
jgi:hypothetical protein